jgi:hypothetical protein
MLRAQNNRRRRLLLLLLWMLAVAAFAGCGDEQGSDGAAQLPDGTVAKVGDRVLTEEAVRRAVVGEIAMKRSARSMPPYLPADIDGCVAAKSRLRAAQVASRGELRRRCERDLDRHELRALRGLIRGEWYRLEYERRGTPMPTTRGTVRWASEHAGVDAAYLRDVAPLYALRLEVLQRLARKHPKDSEGTFAQRGLDAYERELRARYGDDTVCARRYRVPECGGQ